MKHFGSILDFTAQRNEDLLNNFKLIMQQEKKIVMAEIFAKLALVPAKRFYVSEERAAIVISAMLADKALPKMRRNKTEMFQEIFNRFSTQRKLFPNKKFSEIISDVVNQPAPKFYLTPRTISEFIYRLKYRSNGNRFADSENY